MEKYTQNETNSIVIILKVTIDGVWIGDWIN
jgi:hypothetical protein